MQQLELNLKNIFLLIRPYSITTIIAIAILTNVFVSQTIKFDTVMLESILISVLIWSSMVFFLEFMHKHIDNRKRIPNLILFGTIVIVVFLLSNYINALLIFAAIFLCVYGYSLKSKNWILSPFVFVFRGSVEVGIILIILVLNKVPPLSQPYLDKLLLPIFFVTISRNLVGDIRDVERDKYTFPKKFGETMAYMASLIGLIISLVFIPNLLIVFPLLPIFFMLLKRTNGYSTHFMYVICTLFFVVNYITFLVKSDLITNFLLFLGVLLWMTYEKVPRNVNKDLASI